MESPSAIRSVNATAISSPSPRPVMKVSGPRRLIAGQHRQAAAQGPQCTQRPGRRAAQPLPNRRHAGEASVQLHGHHLVPGAQPEFGHQCLAIRRVSDPLGLSDPHVMFTLTDADPGLDAARGNRFQGTHLRRRTG